MGGPSHSSFDHGAAVAALKATGKVFARSAAAAASGDYGNIAAILDPRKLKNGIRESCYAPGFTDLCPIVVSIDLTGSMGEVPGQIQEALPKLIELVVGQGISDHPNVLFIGHDDENVVPSAAFQMSQFEIGAKELVTALNEMIITGQGGGNRGEGYHLSFYAAANHTRLESFEREGKKGYFFMICDEQPYYDDGDPARHGTTPAIAEEVFGDVIEKEVVMLESVRKTLERYHVFIIRPHHTNNGSNRAISMKWQKLMQDAGGNPQHVLEIEKTEDIIPAMALAIGRLAGEDPDELADVLKRGGTDVSSALAATTAIVPVGATGGLAKRGAASAALTKGGRAPRKRND